MLDTELLHKRIDELLPKLHEEADRLLRSGAITDTTALSTIIQVTLENQADLYSKGWEYKNLRRF